MLAKFNNKITNQSEKLFLQIVPIAQPAIFRLRCNLYENIKEHLRMIKDKIAIINIVYDVTMFSSEGM